MLEGKLARMEIKAQITAVQSTSTVSTRMHDQKKGVDESTISRRARHHEIAQDCYGTLV